MAITRSQIARQLLAEGGVSLDDAKMMAPPGEFLAYINPKEADMLRAAGGSGIMTPMGIPSFVSFSDSSRGQTAEDTFSAAASGGASNPSGFGNDGGDSDNNDPPQGVRTGDVFPNLNEVTARDVFKISASNPLLYRSGGERAALASFPVIGPLITAGEQFAYDLPMFQYSRTGPNFKNKFVDDSDDSDDNNTNRIIRRPIMPTQPTQPTQAEKEFAVRFFLPEEYRLADGGDVRQNYGLGKLVKKATRAVKKVVKSPVGKAALTAAAIYGLGGGSFFGRTLPTPFSSLPLQSSASGPGGFAFSNILGNIGRLTGLGEGGLGLSLGKLTSGGATKSSLGPLLGIAGLSAVAGLATPKEEEQESLSQKIADRTGIDIAAIRKEVQDAYAAGDISGLRTKYPFLIPTRAAAAEGGMMDLGGNEMDLRGGGFVPIGKKEKADDVPARLSKNEFVFTADAVRAAGGGSVDRGADLMYKTMKQLENKVA